MPYKTEVGKRKHYSRTGRTLMVYLSRRRTVYVERCPLTLRCLVVDDHREGAEALGAFLAMLGSDVRVVFSGRAAIELAHAFQPAW